ncbi:MAG: leucyl/phenylalanyl-tRNA--protein transferase [Phycisphaerae bacterium]
MNPLLESDCLLAAYAGGLFPMDVDGDLQWFSPDPRGILPLDAFRISRSLKQLIRSNDYEIRLNAAFAEVIRQCADRPEGTWISSEIVSAYTRLHTQGFAHSVEAWRDGCLAGGLYGVALGGAFFGESMFHRRRDASKVALAALVEHMRNRGMRLLDVQFQTPHLARFGAVEIPRDEYLRLLSEALSIPHRFNASPTEIAQSRGRSAGSPSSASDDRQRKTD